MNDYNGRDKFYRTLQYSLKMVLYCVTEKWNAKKGGQEWAEKLVGGLEKGLSHGRKFMRIGKLPESFLALLASLTEKDSFLKLISLVKETLNFFYLWADHAVWLSSAGGFHALPRTELIKV